MTVDYRRRKVAAKLPSAFVTRPFETFTAWLGIVGAWPLLLRADGSIRLYDAFPDWVPVVWVVLMVAGGLRNVVGLVVESRGAISNGSILVSMAVLTYGLAGVYHTDGSGGWLTTIVGTGLVLISLMRGLHLKAVSREVKKVT